MIGCLKERVGCADTVASLRNLTKTAGRYTPWKVRSSLLWRVEGVLRLSRRRVVHLRPHILPSHAQEESDGRCLTEVRERMHRLQRGVDFMTKVAELVWDFDGTNNIEPHSQVGPLCQGCHDQHEVLMVVAPISLRPHKQAYAS